MAWYVEPFREFLRSSTHDKGHLAVDYIAGLIRAEPGDRNMERMGEEIPDSNYQATQQFVTDSPWDPFRVFRKISVDAAEVVNADGWRDTALVLDESGHAKKGKCSAGVKRQYSGTHGKVDNCQVGVYAALVNGNGDGCIIDARLFVPEIWAQDEARCIKAGIPEWHRIHMTKPQLGLEMVVEAKVAGVEFGWVGGDAFYGDNSELCAALDEVGQVFLFDVHCDHNIWLERPLARTGAIRVDAYADGLEAGKWVEVTVRDTTRGELKAVAHLVAVWVWPPNEDGPVERTLLLRRTPGEDETKYALTNMQKVSLTVQRAVFMQAQRYWIERCFQDAKSEMGMSDYQVRQWGAWYHHMALVMMGMLFLLKERILFRREHPLVSIKDLRLLMKALLDNDGGLFERRMAQMEKRHQQRQYDIDRRRDKT